MGDGQTNSTVEAITHSVVRYLVTHRKHDHFRCHLSVLGSLVQQRPGEPRLSLKKICTGRPDLFLVTEEPEGTCLVSLRDPAAAADDVKTFETVLEANGMHDYDELEMRLVAHLFQQPRRRTSLPLLGEFCKTQLGINMKHKLVKFLDARTRAFERDRDGRQQVWCVLESKEEVEAYVRQRFGEEHVGAVRDNLEHAMVDCETQGPLDGIPDSLGPEFWDQSDFPALQKT